VLAFALRREEHDLEAGLERSSSTCPTLNLSSTPPEADTRSARGAGR